MRDYLFRAKLFSSWKWAIGDLVRLKDGDETKTYIYGQGEARPATVCQMLDITDSNKKPIFEGDILRISGVIDDENYEDVVQVYYDQQLHGYLLKANYCKNPSDIEGLGACGEKVEIIGNVFDNPELLNNYKPNAEDLWQITS